MVPLLGLHTQAQRGVGAYSRPPSRSMADPGMDHITSWVPLQRAYCQSCPKKHLNGGSCRTGDLQGPLIWPCPRHLPHF